MVTERLYYTDCYLSNFEARVIATGADGCRVYLDRTAFYPSSGGQPCDLGTLGGQPVLDVVDEESSVAHVLAAPISEGTVQGLVDWTRRYDHMQQHTGQHLLSAAFVELFAFQTVSFHMGSETSTIEIDAKQLTEPQIDDAEQRANAIVREARPVSIRFEQAETVQGLRKLTERTGALRIVEIEGFDVSACGGTHVRSTAELGPIQIRKSEKIRGHVRVEFVCGSRALRRAKQDFRIALELAKQSAVPIGNLVEHIASLRQKLADADKERQKLALDLARREGDAAHQASVPGADGLRRILLRVSTIDEAARAKLQAFTARGRAVALMIATDPPGVLVACSLDSGMNAAAILKDALSRTGGRGGGSAMLAQGSLLNAAAEESLAAALGFLIGIDLAEIPANQTPARPDIVNAK